VRPGHSPVDDSDFEIVWRRFRILAGAVVLAVLAGAMIVAHGWGAPHKHTPYALRPEQLPNDHLTGVGATEARFRATHGPAIGHGGFGPVFSDDAGGQVPTYSIANSLSSDIVDTLIHSFPTGTSEAEALAAVRAHDLPADAHLVRTSLPDRTCKIFTYRSATVAGSGPEVDFGDGTVTVTLYSRPDARYTPAQIDEAYEVVAPTHVECD
jgi:hypothetical protein